MVAHAALGFRTILRAREFGTHKATDTALTGRVVDPGKRARRGAVPVPGAARAAGRIAVTDEEMEEIWSLAPDRTAIQIDP
jgi:hypothetical protein